MTVTVTVTVTVVTKYTPINLFPLFLKIWNLNLISDHGMCTVPLCQLTTLYGRMHLTQRTVEQALCAVPCVLCVVDLFSALGAPR